MDDIAKNNLAVTGRKIISKGGHPFTLDDYSWSLDKNTTVYVGAVLQLMDNSLIDGYLKALSHYAINYSAAHVNNVNDRFAHFLRTTAGKDISPTSIINYRSSLTDNTEWYLGTIRGFLRKWYDLGYR